MALRYNETFAIFKNNILNEHKKIISDTYLTSDKKIELIGKLLTKDNTNEEIVFDYLNLLKEKLDKTDKDKLNSVLLKYECCIEETKFNQAFKSIQKKAYKTKILNLIELIKKYRRNKDENLKIDILKQIKREKVEKYDNTTSINYDYNLELYIFSLYYHFYMHIENAKKNNFVKNEEYQMKLTMQKSGLEYKKNSWQNSKESDNSDKELEYKYLIYGTFDIFLKNLSSFLNYVYEKFCKRFLNNTLTKKEEIELFGDFLFFLSNYDFNDCGDKYKHIWNDSFEDLSFYEKVKIAETRSDSEHTFLLKDNLLYVKNYNDENYSIGNIDNYSFLSLIRYLANISYIPSKH